jgi:hypothetical protein
MVWLVGLLQVGEVGYEDAPATACGSCCHAESAGVYSVTLLAAFPHLLRPTIAMAAIRFAKSKRKFTYRLRWEVEAASTKYLTNRLTHTLDQLPYIRYLTVSTVHPLPGRYAFRQRNTCHHDGYWRTGSNKAARGKPWLARSTGTYTVQTVRSCAGLSHCTAHPQSEGVVARCGMAPLCRPRYAFKKTLTSVCMLIKWQ